MIDLAAPAGTPGARRFHLPRRQRRRPVRLACRADADGNQPQARHGVGGSGRVTITWADGAIRNEWLQVTVNPTAVTGLTAPDVFYFGNLVGDTGDAALSVDAADVLATRSAGGTGASVGAQTPSTTTATGL